MVGLSEMFTSYGACKLYKIIASSYIAYLAGLWTPRCNELAYRKSPNENPERRKSDVLMTETYIYATKMPPVFSNDFALLNIVPWCFACMPSDYR